MEASDVHQEQQKVFGRPVLRGPLRCLQSASRQWHPVMIASPIDQTAFNLAVATLLGACIGFERQWRQRMAGLRTNTLVAVHRP